MDANVKKSVLRMIPYGLFVLTAEGKTEVGGRVTDWSGGDTWAETGNILAASAEVHEALLELARDSPQR